MEDDFDVGAAVDEIGDGLGLAEEASGEEVELEVDTPKVEGEVPAAETPAATEEPASETPAVETPAGETPAPADTAPLTWRKEAGAHWATLPSEVKNEILKREADIFKGIETYKVDATMGKSFKAAFAPFESIIRAQNLDPVATAQGLFAAHHKLATGTFEEKVSLIRALAKDYNVDLAQAVVYEPPYVDPEVKALQDQLAASQSQLAETQRTQLEARRTVIAGEVAAFASDSKNIYFNEVADDIATLIRSGVATTVPEAYEKAVWTNPTTRSKEQTRIANEAAAKTAAEAKARTEAARKATAANVNARARSGSATTPLGSLDDTLEASLANIKSRG